MTEIETSKFKLVNEIKNIFDSEKYSENIKSIIDIGERLKFLEEIKNGTAHIKCSNCRTKRLVDQFKIKQDGSLAKTCLVCAEKYRERADAKKKLINVETANKKPKKNEKLKLDKLEKKAIYKTLVEKAFIEHENKIVVS